jgi:para-aminobenzoate synthetase / 4-amino-4-deoxychorismate lyase
VKVPKVSRPSGPVLIHDASSGQWLLFRKPKALIAATRLSEVVPTLEAVERWVNERGCWAAGYVAYEAAPAFDPALVALRQRRSFPLAWFGIYDRPEAVVLPDNAVVKSSDSLNWKPSVTPLAYTGAIRQIKNRIRRGETYQVNFTFRLRGRIRRNPWDFFRELASSHSPPYGAFLSTGPWAICSFSPELFFSLDGTELVCRPMKGTASRGLTWDQDQRQAGQLQACPKNRAENVMIVDMVRNDLGRIARTGSVAVSDLFTIEKYPTLLQMTSTVRARTNASWSGIVRALFPAASITGAPKARTTRIIASLEHSPRDIYTGCIGFLAPGRRAQFNVAIRTVLVEQATGRAEYGVGGGITWDSAPAAELEEAFTKARLLLEPWPHFKLLETLLWTRPAGFHLLALHLERLARSANYFSFNFSRRAALQALRQAVRRAPRETAKVRLLLERDGVTTCTAAPLGPASPAKPRRLRLAESPVNSSDPFLYHKTTHRRVYEQALASAPGYDEVILWNEKGELTEGCTANLVLEMGGRRYTPPVECGLLAGTCRAWMLQKGELTERVLTVRDLGKANRIYLINSVRGVQEASLSPKR